MAQYINNPTKTDLDCGTADINTDPTSGQVNVAWCNVPAMTYSITDDANGLFSVSADVNAEAGKYNTSHFTVTYKHTIAGTHTAKLVITDTYSNYSKTVNLSGTTNKLLPTISWSTDDAIFNVDDVLSATNNDLDVRLSGDNNYVHCEGNTATMLAATSGTITITAHVTGNAVYADKDFTKDITITNLEKQYITWEQDFSRLKTTDATKSITLSATSSSGLAVTYELSGDKTGLALNKNGNTWTLTYSASECKNTTILAKQTGNGTYAPASTYSLPVKVVDPTKVCDDSETLVNSTVTLKSENTTYNIDIPATMTIQVTRTKTSWAIYSNGFKVELYSGRNGTGTKLHEYSYGASDINKSKTISLTGLNIDVKSVKLISEASNGYDVTSVTYTKQKYCTLSTDELVFETYPNTTLTKRFNVNYANYPIFVERSNDKFTVTPTEFGDCSEYGTKEISVTYTAGADEGNDIGYIYVKDNTGNMQRTCTLNVTVAKFPQEITSTGIVTSYKTTDKVQLHPVASSDLTDFEYSATPAGVVSFNGSEMTFSKADTVAITVTQPGSVSIAPASKTIENVIVSAVTPDIAGQPSATLTCKGTFDNNLLSGGLATVTLRGVANTPVAGHFEWVNANETITVAAGTHDFVVKFVPDDGGMYNTATFPLTVTVNRAESAIDMNNGSVVAGTPLDLSTLITPQPGDGAITYEVTSANQAYATIDNGQFSATQTGDYTIHATKAQTDYYTSAETDFTVTVVEGKIFNGTSSNEWGNETKWEGGVPSTTDRVIIDNNITISGNITVGGLTINAGKTVTVADGATLTVGDKSTIARENNSYGNIIVEAGGQLKLHADGDVQVNDFTLYSGYDNDKQPKSGQVSNAGALTANGIARFILDITPAGQTVAEEWYDITVPFHVNALTGVTRYENGAWTEALTYDTHYAFMDYHEDVRARGQNGWKWYRGTLQPSVMYSFITDATVNRYCFTRAEGNFNTALTHPLQATQGQGENKYKGWNGIGNGTMTDINLEGVNVGEIYYVQMFDHDNHVYTSVDASMHSFAVGAAYFVQVGQNCELSMTIDEEGNNPLRAPKRNVGFEPSKRFGVTLAANGSNCDNLFVACDEDATDTYTIGKDLAKMGNLTGTKTARLWTNAKGTDLCAIHAAYTNNTAIVPLQMYAPAEGEYTLSLDRTPTEDVYLTRNGMIVWDLTMSEYTFDLEAGTNDSYALMVVRRAPEIVTSVEDNTCGTIFAEKIIVDGQLFILRDGALYDAQGRKVENR